MKKNKVLTGLNRKEVNSAKIAGLLLVLFIGVSLWLIFEYVDKERKRDLLSWQSRLALIAEIRAAAVDDYLKQKTDQLAELADNPSLRLFLSEAGNAAGLDEAIIRAQQGYVRNLVRATAARMGLDGRTNRSLNIDADIVYGLAVVDGSYELMISTKGFAGNIDRHQKELNQVFQTGKKAVIDMYVSSGHMVYGMVLPVFHIQNINKGKPVGAVMLLLDPEQDLYPLIKNKQNVTETDETLLVRVTGSGLEYLSPLASGFERLHQMPHNNKKLAAVYAYDNIGGFAQAVDYRGATVLVTGRKLENTGWVLVQKINADEALAESNRHQRFLLTTFSIIVLLIATAFIAIWRHSTSLRLKQLSMKLETHSELLNAITNNVQENILLVDSEGGIIFINPALAQLLELNAQEVVGHKMTSILSADTVHALTSEDSRQAETSVKELEINGIRKTYHVTAVTPETDEYQGARLYVLHDISELKAEQEKREKLSKGIISTLVKAVDLHDPYCANHSVRTREVAVEIATELGLSDDKIESLEMAALLANIGKLFVPREILTKMEPLSEEESTLLYKHIADAVNILSELTFNGPVLDIIAQKNERLDGSGYPAGLKGEEIMCESGILAVANAFVAMASSRAYRRGRPVREVIDLLLEQADKKYDRRVVAALFHIAENKSDWETWQETNTDKPE